MAKKPAVRKPRKKKADDAYTVEGNWVKLPDGTSVEEAVAYATGKKKKLPAPAKRRAAGKPAAKKPKKPGRPTTFDEAKASEMVRFIEEGMSDRRAAREAGINHSTAQGWEEKNPEFAARLARARDVERPKSNEGGLFDDIQDLEVMASSPEYTNAQVAAKKAAFEARLKMAGAYDSRFNDKKSVELTGAAGKDLIPAPGLPPEQMNELAVRIAKVREETRRKKMESAGDE